MKILKKPAGSVRFRFYNQKPKKPNRTEPKPKKPSQNRAKSEKPSQNWKNQAKTGKKRAKT